MVGSPQRSRQKLAGADPDAQATTARTASLFFACVLAAALAPGAAHAEEAARGTDVRRILMEMDDALTASADDMRTPQGVPGFPRRGKSGRRGVQLSLGRTISGDPAWMDIGAGLDGGSRANANIHTAMRAGGWRIAPSAGFGAYARDDLQGGGRVIGFRVGMAAQYDFGAGPQFELRIAQFAGPTAGSPFAAAMATLSVPLGF